MANWCKRWDGWCDETESDPDDLPVRLFCDDDCEECSSCEDRNSEEESKEG